MSVGTKETGGCGDDDEGIRHYETDDKCDQKEAAGECGSGSCGRGKQ